MTENLDSKILAALLVAEISLNNSQIRRSTGGNDSEVVNVLYNLKARGYIQADRAMVRRDIKNDRVKFSLTELGRRTAELSN